MTFYTLRTIKTLGGDGGTTPPPTQAKHLVLKSLPRTPTHLHLSHQSSLAHKYFSAEDAKAFHSHAAAQSHQEKIHPKLCSRLSRRTASICSQLLQSRLEAAQPMAVLLLLPSTSASAQQSSLPMGCPNPSRFPTCTCSGSASGINWYFFSHPSFF